VGDASNWHQGSSNGLIAPIERSTGDKKKETAYLMEIINKFVD
jgi:hypothetical protein